MQCLLDHIVLNVDDDGTMMEFYTGVLELGAERLQEYRAGEVPFPSVRLNADTVIDLFPKKMWNGDKDEERGRPHLNHFCLALDKPQWDALRQRLADKGIDLEEGPVRRWGAHGSGVSIYFRDPEGNLIEARYYDETSADERCLLGS